MSTVSDEKGDGDLRARTLKWRKSADDIAVRLAAERGFTKEKGGVSEMLAQLVEQESAKPRLALVEPTPGYKEAISAAEKTRDEIIKKIREKKNPPLN